jgi:type IV pilus assembly protein PilV
MTMIESLVAIVVLSFGMLGVVGLQAAALQSNKEARYQSSAVRLARELGALLRGNKDVAIAASSADNPYLVEFTGSLPSTSADCFAGACAITLDVASFQTSVADASTPNCPGRVSVHRRRVVRRKRLPVWDCSGTVARWWSDRLDAGHDRPCRRRLRADTAAQRPGWRATRPGVVVAHRREFRMTALRPQSGQAGAPPGGHDARQLMVALVIGLVITAAAVAARSAAVSARSIRRRRCEHASRPT